MNPRVLIVDDDEDLLDTLRRLLERFGYTCLTAASGAAAIAVLDALSPDLVVTDLHMPGTDGLAVARRARQAVPPIPVVVITAYPTRRMEQELQAVGGAIHLSKPFANADMVDAVRRALGSRDSGALTTR
ncbi:MAG TPA: response regulator [Candidatus Methylomirabilis sp.]|nr:response regulator [Candidatus Methylomirabilis sp.]